MSFDKKMLLLSSSSYIFYEVINKNASKSRVCNDDNKWFWDVVTQVLLKVFATDVIH